MAKVKKESKSADNVSKIPKKSHGPIQSIKSPKHRKKSAETPLKTKKTKDFSRLKIKEANNTDILLKVQKKSKVKENRTPSITEIQASAFEDKFNIKIQGIKSAIETVVRLRKENPKIKNQLFENEAFPISLMVNCHKIPSGFQKILRIPLAHTLLTPDDDICLIVSEVKGMGNKEHEKHIEHYEDLFAKKGVDNIKKIMTVHEFKTEYETYEQKRRLVDLYDHFLVCSKVSGKVVQKCGKLFYNRRKVPASVKLQVTKLKEHIDKMLSKAYFHLHTNGDSYFVDFGNSTMNSSNLLDNFISVVEFLDTEFPGGFNNIKGLHVTSPRAPSVPVYISTTNPNEIPKVKVQFKNKFVPKTVRGELTTKLNSEVVVRPSGQVTVIKKKTKRTHEGDSNSEVPKKKLKSGNKKDKIVDQIALVEEKLSKKKKKPDKIAEIVESDVPAEKSVLKKNRKHKNKKNEGSVQNGTEIVSLDGKASKKKSLKKKEDKVEESIKNAQNSLKTVEKALKKKKKETIVQSEVNAVEEVPKIKKKKVKRVMHLDNSITIEDLSVTPEKKVKNPGKMIESKKTTKQGEKKKLKNKKANLKKN